MIPRPGAKVLSDWLDTVGVFARDVADAAFFVAGLTGRPGLKPNGQSERLKVAVLRAPYPGTLEPEGEVALDRAAAALRAAGTTSSTCRRRRRCSRLRGYSGS